MTILYYTCWMMSRHFWRCFGQMETVLLDVALYVNNWWKCYTRMYTVVLVMHLLASLLCHLTALNKSTLIAYERVPDSWSGCWMCMVSVAIYTVCAVVSAERPWLIEGCCWKNRLGGKDCETGTQNPGNFSVRNSHLGIQYVYLLLQYIHIILIYTTNDSAYSSMSETL